MARMKTRISVIALLTGVLLISYPVFAGEAQKAQTVKAQTVEVLPNIYTMVHGDGMDSNTTFIITRDGVIVIDTRPTPVEARKVMQEIRKHTDLPLLYTINTHYHGDHTFGNQVFKDSKTIIAHKNVRGTLIDSGKEHLEFFKTFGLPGMDEVEITLPNMVYEKQMDLYPGEYHLQLIHRGRGHTDGDTIIYLEELRMVIAGDLVFNKKIPYMGDGYVDEWIESLDFIEKNLRNETVIPGHGQVGGRPLMIAMKHYLISLKELVVKALKEGKSLKETQDAVRPVLEKKYQDWAKLDWLNGNIERAWLEYSVKSSM
ncbi:MAG: MBL fold metallo-hydrolase [Nitrospinaceae bacterium]